MVENPEALRDTEKELSARELVAVLVRFLAVVTLIGVIASLPSFAVFLIGFSPNSRTGLLSLSGLLVASGALLISLIIVAWLWLFPETIAYRIVPEEHDGYIRFDLSFREIQALVFSLFGIYLLTLALPRLARVVANLWFNPQPFIGGLSAIEIQYGVLGPALIEPIAQLVLAFFLMRWSRQIVRGLYIANDAENREDIPADDNI